MASTMDEMQAFYDAFSPRAEEAIAYCDQFPLDDMPEDAQQLLQLLYSLIMVSFPVEAWRQPHVPDSGAAYLDLLIEPHPVSDARRVLRARDRWVDVDAGEVRVAGGRSSSRATASPPSTPPSCRAGATEIDLGDVTLLPGLMDMELNMLLGGPSGGNKRSDVQDDPAFRTLRGTLNCRTTLLAGFTTARNLGLFVKTGGYLLDVALGARDRQRLDRRPPARARRPRDHADRRPPRPDDVPAARARHHAAQRRGGHRERRARGAQGGALPDQVRRPAHQDLRVGRRDVAQRARRRAAVLRRGARRDRRRGAPRRPQGRGARARRRRASAPASAPASTASSTARSRATRRSR